MWLGAVVIVMVVVPLVVFGFRTGECFDSVPAAGSYCASGPAVGVGGAVLLCLGGGLFVAHWAVVLARHPDDLGCARGVGVFRLASNMDAAAQALGHAPDPSSARDMTPA